MLARWATKASARRILRSLLGDTQPDVVRLAALDSTAVLWIGDVLIRDAVPLGAAVFTVAGGVATLQAIAFDRSLGAVAAVMTRLARSVVAACTQAAHRQVVLPETADRELAAFCRTAAQEHTAEGGGPWTLTLSEP